MVVGRAMAKLMAGDSDSIRKYLTKELLGAKSMAAEILKDVTGWRFMKLDARTMGEDVTLPMKLRHTLGLAAEWGVNFFKKRAEGLVQT